MDDWEARSEETVRPLSGLNCARCAGRLAIILKVSDLPKETGRTPASDTFDMTPVNVSKKKRSRTKFFGTAVMTCRPARPPNPKLQNSFNSVMKCECMHCVHLDYSGLQKPCPLWFFFLTIDRRVNSTIANVRNVERGVSCRRRN